MRQKALEACHYVMAQMGSSVTNAMVTVPLGRPAEYSSGEFLKDWPPQVLQPTLAQDTSPTMLKRSGFFGRTVSEDLEGEEVECPFEQPPVAKRRRFCDDNLPLVFQPNMVVEDDSMMSYGVVGEQA